MNPEIFLFSRTAQTDYRYLFPLPPQCSEAVQTFLQTRISDMQSGQADGTVHFFLSETDAVLVRAVNSKNRDLYGRPILSLEGLYCPAEDVRPFWLCLPRLVPGFWFATSMYTLLVQGETTVSLPVVRLLDACAQHSPKHAQFKAMQQDISTADMPASFTFDADGLHFSTQPPAYGRKRWSPQESRSCDICVIFNRKTKTAHLEAVSGGSVPYTIVQSADVARESNGWSFSALEQSAAAVEAELDRRGWQYAPDKGGKL